MKTVLYLGPAGRQWWGKDRHGWHLLNGETGRPVWVVTDLAEESFAEIEMPRLYGRDRIAFAARQLASRFPDTPYRTLLPGRGGSLLERIAPKRQTFVGIAGAERLNAELDDIAAPIAGIWPVSLLLAEFCRSRHLPAELLVALPNPETLRIVFIKNRTPLLTRLAPTPNNAATQLEEITRTQRYLENNRLLQRGMHACPVLLLGNPEDFAGLPASALHLISPPPPWDAKSPDDWRFPLFDLALRSPAGQVAPLPRRADFVAGRLRKGALAASVIGLVIAVAAAGSNVSAIFEVMQKQRQLAASAETANIRLAEVERRIEAMGVAPELVQRAIALDTQEIVPAPALDQALNIVAKALSKAIELRLKQLELHLLAAGESACANASATTPQSHPATTTADHSGRSVELSMEVRLPATYGPRDRIVALRNLSADLKRAGNVRIVKDPALEQNQGALQGGAAKEVEQTHVWCMSLPWSPLLANPVPHGPDKS